MSNRNWKTSGPVEKLLCWKCISLMVTKVNKKMFDLIVANEKENVVE